MLQSSAQPVLTANFQIAGCKTLSLLSSCSSCSCSDVTPITFINVLLLSHTICLQDTNAHAHAHAAKLSSSVPVASADFHERKSIQGRLVAMDIHKGRLGALKTAAAAQGLAEVISTRTGDLCHYSIWVAALPQEQQHEHQYDRVLVDAPCSGLGVLAKR